MGPGVGMHIGTQVALRELRVSVRVDLASTYGYGRIGANRWSGRRAGSRTEGGAGSGQADAPFAGIQPAAGASCKGNDTYPLGN